MTQATTGLHRNKVLVAAFLMATLSVGTATGVQRTVISLYSSELLGEEAQRLYYILVYLPILSFGLLKGTIDLIGGWISDRIGRKTAAVLGSGIYLIGALTLFFGKTLAAVGLANLLIGAGQGMLLAAAMIALSDIGASSEQAFSFGLMESSVYGGYGIGSVLAGYVSQAKGHHEAFWISVSAAALAFSVALLGIRETRALAGFAGERGAGSEMSTLEVYGRCLKSWTLRVAYFLGHIAKFSDTLIWGVFPLYLASLGYTDEHIGWVQGVSTFVWAASMPFTGRISDKLGRKIPSALGLGLKALGIFGVYFGKSFYLDLVSAGMIGLGVGLYYPIMPAISTDVVPSGVKGRAIGLYRSIRDYGYFTGALALGLVTGWGYSYAFLLTVALLGVGAIAIATGVKETRPFWPAYPDVVRHAEKVKEAVEVLKEMFESYRGGDLERAKMLAKRIKELEDAADELRVTIDRSLWLSVLRGQDKADFARLTQRIDRVAAFALGSSRRLLLVEPGEISEELKSTLSEFLDGLSREVELLTEALKLMGEDLEGSLPLIEEVGDLETELDILHQRALSELEGHAERIDVLTLLNLRDLVEFLEYAADVAEDAADVMRVIVFKHSAWSV